VTRPRRPSTQVVWLAPLAGFLAVFFLYPLAGVVARSFGGEPLGLEHYARAVREPVYLWVLANTFRIAAAVAVLCLVLGYPVAHVLAAASPRALRLLLIFIVVPYFTGALVRTYAWIVLLGREGVVNQLLLRLGLVERPVPLMYNTTGVLIGMTYILLPYMVLALYSVMKGIDPGLTRAARSLGATGPQAFVRVLLPLTLPGIGGGFLLVFILALGFFVTPALMGSARETMIAMVIENQVGVVLNWGFASALAMVLLVATVLGFLAYDRVLGLRRLFETRP
jgi:putative spermidine/putrescine transport system permease protein